MTLRLTAARSNHWAKRARYLGECTWSNMFWQAISTGFYAGVKECSNRKISFFRRCLDIAFAETLKMDSKYWMNVQKGPRRIWTAIAGFRVQSANRYTIGPLIDRYCKNCSTLWLSCINNFERGKIEYWCVFRFKRKRRYPVLNNRLLVNYIIMDPLGFEPRAFCMRSRRDTTTPWARCWRHPRFAMRL